VRRFISNRLARGIKGISGGLAKLASGYLAIFRFPSSKLPVSVLFSELGAELPQKFHGLSDVLFGDLLPLSLRIFEFREAILQLRDLYVKGRLLVLLFVIFAPSKEHSPVK
jgi:hypothetical protein